MYTFYCKLDAENAAIILELMHHGFKFKFRGERWYIAQ